MKKVRLYTTGYCPYCRAAKSLLRERGIEFEEITLDDDPLMKKRVMEEMGWKTVPIILIGDRLIGGFRELSALVKEGRLEELLEGLSPATANSID